MAGKHGMASFLCIYADDIMGGAECTAWRRTLLPYTTIVPSVIQFLQFLVFVCTILSYFTISVLSMKIVSISYLGVLIVAYTAISIVRKDNAWAFNFLTLKSIAQFITKLDQYYTQVKNCLKHLNPRKATGVDKIPAWILKRFSDDLAPVVHNIVTASIKQCKYPSQYKHALISPVAKVRNPSDVENDFRQISVLPQLAKVIEKLQLQLNISDLNIKNNQHAFTRGRSTVSALISTTQNWYNATDNFQSGRKGVHAIFIDFRKAFDLVNHNILLEKLASMNVSKPFWLYRSEDF